MKKPAKRASRARRSRARTASNVAEVSRSLSNAPVMIFELAPSGKITLLAGGLAEKLGLKPADAVGRNVLEMHKDIPRAVELIRRALKGEAFCTQIHVRGRTLEMCFSPRRARDGAVAGITGWATDVTELHESEEKYRTIFMGATEGILVADSDSKRFIYANPAICSLLGYTEDELLRLGVDGIHPRDALPKVISYFEAQTRGEIVAAPSLPCLRKDGSIVYADIKSGPAVIGGRACTVGFFTDISERQRSEERYRTLFENMLNGLAYCRMVYEDGRPADFVYLEVNQAFEALTGLKDVTGKKVSEVIPGIRETDPHILETYGRVARTGKPERFEAYVSALKMWFSISVYSPARDHFVAVFDVITESKKTEAALRDSEERFRQAFEFAGIGMALLTPEGRWVRVNRALSGMLGYSEEELRRTTFQDLTHPDDLSKNLGEARRLLAGEIPRMQAEKRYRHRDGHYVWADLNTSVVRSDDGKPLYYVSQIEDISKRKEAEEGLTRTTRYLRTIIESEPECVKLVSPEGKLLDMNPAGLDMLQCGSLGEAQERPLVEFVHPEDRKAFAALHARVMSGESGRLVFRMVGLRGRQLWLEIQAVPLRDEGNRVWALLGITRDITERKRAEEQLSFSERKFALAFNASPDAIAITELDTGNILDVNETFVTWSGYAREELIGRSTKPMGIWAKPEDRETVMRKLASGAGSVQIESAARLKDGSLREVVFFGSIIKIEGRDYMLSLTHDITEMRRLDRERQNSLSLLEATLESTADGILVVDQQGRVASFNQRFLRIWSIPPELAAARDDSRLLEFVRDQMTFPDNFVSKVRELYAHPEAESFDTLFFKDGRVVERYSQAQRVAGNIVGRVWSFRDITQRVRAERDKTRLLESERAARAEAEAASKAKDDFLAIVSHELRTPLTAILGWSWLLRSGKLSEEERQNALDIILRNMASQRQIVEDLIDVSSLTRGKFNLARKPVELGTVLTTVCGSLDHLIRGRSIRLTREVRGTVAVDGDEGRLQQVFSNLIHNAVKFTPEGGDISVSARREGDAAVVEVRDSGRGIPAAFLPHLFQPFRQEQDPLIREHRGLGLGLTIVKRLVELHQGTVSAESAGQGQGAVFTVRLPAIAWPQPGSVAPAAHPAPDSRFLAGVKVLVVEDEEDARTLLEQLLARHGASVAAAADAPTAFARVQAEAPDLLLFDIALPGEDGVSLLRRVRELGGRHETVPAVALTALAKEEDRLRALQAGFQLYLTKPAEPVQILEAVRALVGRR